MQETIERARVAEAFMNATGLSDNLEDLAKLVDQDEDEEGQVGILSWWIHSQIYFIRGWT